MKREPRREFLGSGAQKEAVSGGDDADEADKQGLEEGVAGDAPRLPARVVDEGLDLGEAEHARDEAGNGDVAEHGVCADVGGPAEERVEAAGRFGVIPSGEKPEADAGGEDKVAESGRIFSNPAANAFDEEADEAEAPASEGEADGARNSGEFEKDAAGEEGHQEGPVEVAIEEEDAEADGDDPSGPGDETFAGARIGFQCGAEEGARPDAGCGDGEVLDEFEAVDLLPGGPIGDRLGDAAVGGAEEDAEGDYGGDGGDERGVSWAGEDDEQSAEEEGVGEDEQDDIELVEAETDAIGEGVEGADGEEREGGDGATDGGPALAGGGEGEARPGEDGKNEQEEADAESSGVVDLAPFCGADGLGDHGESGEAGKTPDDADGEGEARCAGLAAFFDAEGKGRAESEEEEGEDEVYPGDAERGRAEFVGGGRELGVVHPGGQGAPGDEATEGHPEKGDSAQGVEGFGSHGLISRSGF